MTPVGVTGGLDLRGKTKRQPRRGKCSKWSAGFSYVAAMASDQPIGVVELRIPAQAEYLQLVRSVVGAAVSCQPSVPPDRVTDLRLAVSEAATNAIEAHGEALVNDRVTMRCQLTESQIILEITDQGGGFDPQSVPDLPEVEDVKRLQHESGMGLSLMRHLTDETTVQVGESGTVIRLKINFE